MLAHTKIVHTENTTIVASSGWNANVIITNFLVLVTGSEKHVNNLSQIIHGGKLFKLGWNICVFFDVKFAHRSSYCISHMHAHLSKNKTWKRKLFKYKESNILYKYRINIKQIESHTFTVVFLLLHCSRVQKYSQSTSLTNHVTWHCSITLENNVCFKSF